MKAIQIIYHVWKQRHPFVFTVKMWACFNLAVWCSWRPWQIVDILVVFYYYSNLNHQACFFLFCQQNWFVLCLFISSACFVYEFLLSLVITLLSRSCYIFCMCYHGYVYILTKKPVLFYFCQWKSVKILCCPGSAYFRVPAFPWYYIPRSKTREYTNRERWLHPSKWSKCFARVCVRP